MWVVRNDGSGEMMRKFLEDLKKVFNIFITIFNNNLEGSKEFSAYKISLLFSSEVLEGDLDGSWFVRAIALWNGVVFERYTSTHQLSTI